MDKVQKIREEVARIQLYTQSEVLKQVLDYIDKVQKEPVSEDLKIELEKYIKGHFTIDTEQLDRFGIEEKDYMYSMDKSDMLALVEHFTNWQKTKEELVSEELEEASKNYALNNTPWDDCKDEIQESFKAGAKWQSRKLQYGKDRK